MLGASDPHRRTPIGPQARARRGCSCNSAVWLPVHAYPTHLHSRRTRAIAARRPPAACDGTQAAPVGWDRASVRAAARADALADAAHARVVPAAGAPGSRSPHVTPVASVAPVTHVTHVSQHSLVQLTRTRHSAAATRTRHSAAAQTHTETRTRTHTRAPARTCRNPLCEHTLPRARTIRAQASPVAGAAGSGHCSTRTVPRQSPSVP